ncbi:acyl carrier protein [Candidatus Poribacteria bacterium]|nr:acyl carrier protein [Candidatus Poribacteria bacterium]
MKEKDRLVRTIFRAVDEYNRGLSEGGPLEKSLDKVLFGKSGRLDSLGLVNFIVLIEEKIEEEYGMAIVIADEKAMSQKRSPFKTIGRLAEYVSQLLEENKNG